MIEKVRAFCPFPEEGQEEKNMYSAELLVLYHQFTKLDLSMVAISLVARWFGGEVTCYHTTNEVPADLHSHPR